MKRVTVLLVNNYPSMVTRLCEMTENAELDVVASASSPAAAIDAVQAHRPDLVILDMNLDEGSGLEVLKYLNRQALHTQTFVVTASKSDQLAKECFRLGARHVFDTAFELEGLTAALRSTRNARCL